MGKVSSYIELPASADAVWKLIGGFGSLPDWLSYIPSSELGEGGRTRQLVNPDGSEIIERLMHFDERGRTYTYHIVRAPFPVTDYYSTLRVSEKAQGDGSRVEWSGEFAPYGVSEREATAIFQAIYDDGLMALAGRFSK